MPTYAYTFGLGFRLGFGLELELGLRLGLRVSFLGFISKCLCEWNIHQTSSHPKSIFFTSFIVGYSNDSFSSHKLHLMVNTANISVHPSEK